MANITIETKLTEIKNIGNQTDLLLFMRNGTIEDINCLNQSANSSLANDMFLRLLPGRIKALEKSLAITQEQIDFNIAYCDMLLNEVKIARQQMENMLYA